MKKILALLSLLACQLGTAQATAVISNVSYTDRSITFTATGDLTGYATPTEAYYLNQFSIIYTGNLYNNSSYQINQYTGTLFSNATESLGNTGGFPSTSNNYTWIQVSGDYNLQFSGTPFTVSWDTAKLNTSGTGEFQFVWGNGSGSTSNFHTFLSSVAVTDGTVSAVPEPETYAMLLAGLGLLGFMTRRKSGKKAA